MTLNHFSRLITEHTWHPRLAARSNHLVGSEIRELLKLIGDPNIISFAGGVPDPSLLPREELRDCYQRQLADPRKAQIGLQYMASDGYLPLREWIAAQLSEDGVNCSASNVLILNGSQQGIDFAARLFIDPGDRVLVQNPTYLGALQAFRSFECAFDTLPGESECRAWQTYRERGADPKLIYVTPDFQNPTGISLSLATRLRIINLARDLDSAILEDHAYRHLRFEGAMLPSLTALELGPRHIDAGRALYLGTFSKIIAPGLRVAWLAAPAALLEKLIYIKQASDVQTSAIHQMVLAEILPASFSRVVAAQRIEYRRRRDSMLEAMSRYFPEEASWTKPEGGFFVWVTLPEGLDAANVLRQSLQETRVAFVPGKSFFADGSIAHTFRMSYSLANPEKIDKGIKLLGALLKRLIVESQR